MKKFFTVSLRICSSYTVTFKKPSALSLLRFRFCFMARVFISREIVLAAKEGTHEWCLRLPKLSTIRVSTVFQKAVAGNYETVDWIATLPFYARLSCTSFNQHRIYGIVIPSIACIQIECVCVQGLVSMDTLVLNLNVCMLIVNRTVTSSSM